MAVAALFDSSITAHCRKHKEIQPITKKFNDIKQVNTFLHGMDVCVYIYYI